MKPPLVAASILSADFGRLAEEVGAVDAAGADWIHVDVMDGRFVPNITLGPVVVMTVNPGFGGQAFLPAMLPKIRALRTLCETKRLDPWIEVDGGQNGAHAAEALAAGANAIVAGSAIFGAHDYARAIAALRGPARRRDANAHA